MEKKLAYLLVIIMMLGLIGCGKRDDGADVQASDNTSFKIQVDPIINRDDDSDTEEVDEEIVEEPVKYSCMDEIKTASPDSGLVQIDDMLFQYGSKFSEVASEIEQSECTYEAEYNVSSVVPAGEEVGIRFYKEGNQYFTICVENRESETVELNDCVVSSIRALNASMGNAYYAGFSDDEMTYSNIKVAMKDNEPDKEILGSDYHGNSELGIKYTFLFEDQRNEMHVYFIFDGVTNELNKFEIASKNYDRVGWPW